MGNCLGSVVIVILTDKQKNLSNQEIKWTEILLCI